MKRITILFTLFSLKVLVASNQTSPVDLTNFHGKKLTYYLLRSEDKIPLLMELMNEGYIGAPKELPLKKDVAFQRRITNESLRAFFVKAAHFGNSYVNYSKAQQHLIWLAYENNIFVGFISVQRGFEASMLKDLKMPESLFAQQSRANLTTFIHDEFLSSGLAVEIMKDMTSLLLSTDSVAQCIFVHNAWDEWSIFVAQQAGLIRRWENTDYVLWDSSNFIQ